MEFRREVLCNWYLINYLLRCGKVLGNDRQELIHSRMYELLNKLTSVSINDEDAVLQSHKIALSSSGALYDIFMAIWISLSEHVNNGHLAKSGYIKLMRAIEIALCGPISKSVLSGKDEKYQWNILWNMERKCFGELNRVGFFFMLSELLETWSSLIAMPCRRAFAWALLHSIVDTRKVPPKLRASTSIRQILLLSTDKNPASNNLTKKCGEILSISKEGFQRAVEVQTLFRTRREGVSVALHTDISIHCQHVGAPDVPISDRLNSLSNAVPFKLRQGEDKVVLPGYDVTECNVGLDDAVAEQASMCDSLEEKSFIDDHLELHRQGLWAPSLAIPELQRNDADVLKSIHTVESPSSLGILVRGTNASPSITSVANSFVGPGEGAPPIDSSPVHGAVHDRKALNIPQNKLTASNVASKYLERFKRDNLEYEEIMRALEMEDLANQYGFGDGREVSKLDSLLAKIGSSALTGVKDAAFIEGVLNKKRTDGSNTANVKQKTLSTPYRNAQTLMDPVTVRHLNANKDRDKKKSDLNSNGENPGAVTTTNNGPHSHLNQMEDVSLCSVIENTNYMPILTDSYPPCSRVVDQFDVASDVLDNLSQSVLSTVAELVEGKSGAAPHGDIVHDATGGSLFTDTLFDDMSMRTDPCIPQVTRGPPTQSPLKKQEIKYILKNDCLLSTNLLPAYPSRDTTKVRIHMLHEADSVVIPVKTSELQKNTHIVEPRTIPKDHITLSRRGVCNEVSMVRSKLSNVKPTSAQPTHIVSNLIPCPVPADQAILALESDAVPLVVSRSNSPTVGHAVSRSMRKEVLKDPHQLAVPTGADLDDIAFDDDLVNSAEQSPRTTSMLDFAQTGFENHSTSFKMNSSKPTSRKSARGRSPNRQPLNNIHFINYMKNTHSLDTSSAINANVPRPHVYSLHANTHSVKPVAKRTSTSVSAMSMIDRKLKELGHKKIPSSTKKRTNVLQKFLPDPLLYKSTSSSQSVSGHISESSICSVLSGSVSMPVLQNGFDTTIEMGDSVYSSKGKVPMSEELDHPDDIMGSPKPKRQQSLLQSIRKSASCLSPQSILSMDPDILPVGAVMRSPPSVVTSQYAAAPLNMLGDFNMHSADSIRSIQSPVEKARHKRDIAKLPHFLHAPKYSGGVVSIPCAQDPQIQIRSLNPHGHATIFTQDRSIMSDMSVSTDNYGTVNDGEVNGLSGVSISSKSVSKFTDHSMGVYSKGSFMGSCASSSAPWIPEGSLSTTVHSYGNKLLGVKEELAYKRFEKNGFCHDSSESRAVILRQNTARASFEGYSKQNSLIPRGVVNLNPFQEKKNIR